MIKEYYFIKNIVKAARENNLNNIIEMNAKWKQ